VLRILISTLKSTQLRIFSSKFCTLERKFSIFLTGKNFPTRQNLGGVVVLALHLDDVTADKLSMITTRRYKTPHRHIHRVGLKSTKLLYAGPSYYLDG